jgi:hypothetical protein
MHFNLDPDSKVTDDSREHSVKHASQRISAVQGIQIDFSCSQNVNASRSIRFNFVPDSKSNDEIQ